MFTDAFSDELTKLAGSEMDDTTRQIAERERAKDVERHTENHQMKPPSKAGTLNNSRRSPMPKGVSLNNKK